MIGYLKAINSMLNTEREAILSEIVNEHFINQMLAQGNKHSNNNTIHNQIKDILIKCIEHEYKKTVPLLLNADSCEFTNLASRITSKNSAFAFENQIYHIFQAVLRKAQENEHLEELESAYPCLSDVIATVREKEVFYAFKAGGGLRKESSNWGGDSSSEIIFEQFLLTGKKEEEEKNLLSNPSYVIEDKQEHWFDCGGLPLDSDSEKDSVEVGNSQDLKLNS